MMSLAEARSGHPCVTSGCGHPAVDHVATPELASSTEVVVWCVACRHHEVVRPGRLRFPWSRGARRSTAQRISKPS